MLEAVGASSVITARIVDIVTFAGLTLDREPVATGDCVISGCFKICQIQFGVAAVSCRVIEIRLEICSAGNDKNDAGKGKHELVLDERNAFFF